MNKRPRVQQQQPPPRPPPGLPPPPTSPRLQQEPPEVIFKDLTSFEQTHQRKRMVFFDQLEEMVEKCTFACPPGMAPYLKNSEKTRIRIPNDLDPMKFRGKLFFVDYMNIFPVFQKALSVKEKLRTDAEVWKDTSFQDKIKNLYQTPYRAALVDYVYSLKGSKVPPTSGDWVFIVCQGQKKCGSLFYESCPFFHGLNLLIVEVPCSDQLNYHPLFTSRDCHVLFDKNEVDDYFLLYCVLYFQAFRDEVARRSRVDSRYTAFLWNQSILLVSNDNYAWGTDRKNYVEKLPTPWPTGFAFSMGSTTTIKKYKS